MIIGKISYFSAKSHFTRILIKKKMIYLLVSLSLLIYLYYILIESVEVVLYRLKDREFSIESGLCISKVNNSATPIIITKFEPSWNDLTNNSWSNSITDGFWKPTNCKSNQSLAIIIPYRNREIHLRKILSHLHPFLQKQTVEYQIIVIEQSQKGTFNKGALINIGIKEAMSMQDRRFTCFIIHDVDMLPIMENNIYQCLDNPLHLGAAVDKYNYKLIYKQLIGGVLALTSKQLHKVNGFSNIYEGWGGEDDDMTERIRLEKLKIVRYPLKVGRYDMIKHKQDKGNPTNDLRYYYLKGAGLRYKVDGLNSISYSKLNVSHINTQLVHWILVEIPTKSFFIKPGFNF